MMREKQGLILFERRAPAFIARAPRGLFHVSLSPNIETIHEEGHIQSLRRCATVFGP